VCATEELPFNLDTMANHFALTMLADGSHRLDCALKAIERVPRPSGFDDKSLVIFVATDFAICHSILLLWAFAIVLVWSIWIGLSTGIRRI
jgi:hypothetical protein